ncbi:MAG: hypothetical protein WDA00_06600 [Eubacteriales bacterium]
MKKLSVLLLVLSLLLGMAGCKGKDTDDTTTTVPGGEMFDFFAVEDMGRYATLAVADYKGLTLTLPRDEFTVTEADIDQHIHNLMKQKMSGVPEVVRVTDRAIQAGDEVYLFYTVYYEGVAVLHGSNTHLLEPNDPIVVGQGEVLEGVDNGLLGLVPDDMSVTRTHEGTVASDDVVYLWDFTITYHRNDGSTVEKNYTPYDAVNKVPTYHRIDLARPGAYSAAFVEALTGRTIGEGFSFELPGEGDVERVEYSGGVGWTAQEVTVDLEATFPEDELLFGELSGKTVTYVVAVLYIEEDIYPPLSAEIVTDVFKYNAKTPDPVKEYRDYIKDLLQTQVQSELDAEVETRLATIITEATTVSSWPAGAVEYYYNQAYQQMEDAKAYWESLGYTFLDMGDFIVWYQQLRQDTDGIQWLQNETRSLVRFQIAMFTIAQQEGITLSNAEYVAQVEQIIKANGNQYTADEIIAGYGETYIRQLALFQKVLSFLKEQTTITLE